MLRGAGGICRCAHQKTNLINFWVLAFEHLQIELLRSLQIQWRFYFARCRFVVRFGWHR